MAREAGDGGGLRFLGSGRPGRKQNFAAALKKLQAARELHDKGRIAPLRKPQNPTSHPNEEIFLRSCDELKVYWQMQERLRSGGYLTARPKTRTRRRAN